MNPSQVRAIASGCKISPLRSLARTFRPRNAETSLPRGKARPQGRFPRRAVVAGALLLSAPRLLAQSAPDTVVARAALAPTELKSGTTATLLSTVLPGLGHLYAEDRRTGAVLMTIFAAAVALTGGHGENCQSGPVAALLCAGPWWYGVIDAHNAVARYNRAHTTQAADIPVHPVMTVGANGTVGFGISMRLAH
jgi:hypothetical protein